MDGSWSYWSLFATAGSQLCSGCARELMEAPLEQHPALGSHQSSGEQPCVIPSPAWQEHPGIRASLTWFWSLGGTERMVLLSTSPMRNSDTLWGEEQGWIQHSDTGCLQGMAAQTPLRAAEGHGDGLHCLLELPLVCLVVGFIVETWRWGNMEALLPQAPVSVSAERPARSCCYQRGLWGWGESREQWGGSSLWTMDFSSTVVSLSFFPGLTSLTASLGSCFCLFPLLRAAGKVLLDLFHCLPCLMAPPGPSPSRMNSSRRALARSQMRNHHQQQELGLTVLGRLPYHETPATRAPGQSLGQPLGVGRGLLRAHGMSLVAALLPSCPLRLLLGVQEATGDSGGCAVPVVGAAAPSPWVRAAGSGAQLGSDLPDPSP